MRPQHGDRARVERDDPSRPLRLRLGDLWSRVDEHPRVLHREPAELEVDVDPSQAGDLASPHAGDEEQPPHRHESIVGDEGQEPANVGRGPHGHLGVRPSGRDDRVAHVAIDQVPPQRVLQRPAQQPMAVTDGRGRQRTVTEPTWCTQQHCLPRPDVLRRELTQAHRAEMRDDVIAHAPLVRHRRRRSTRRLRRHEPLDKELDQPSVRPARVGPAASSSSSMRNRRSADSASHFVRYPPRAICRRPRAAPSVAGIHTANDQLAPRLITAIGRPSSVRISAPRTENATGRIEIG